MDPKKMQAFVGGGQQAGGGGAQHPEPEDQLESEEQGEPAMARFDALIPLMEDHAGEIEDAAAMVAADSGAVLANMAEPDPVSVEEAMGGFEDLDDELKAAFASALPQAADEDYALLAQHLADEGMIEDADLVSAWLCLVKAGLAQAPVADEGEVEDDDMLPDESEAEDMMAE